MRLKCEMKANGGIGLRELFLDHRSRESRMAWARLYCLVASSTKMKHVLIRRRTLQWIRTSLVSIWLSIPCFESYSLISYCLIVDVCHRIHTHWGCDLVMCRLRSVQSFLQFVMFYTLHRLNRWRHLTEASREAIQSRGSTMFFFKSDVHASSFHCASFVHVGVCGCWLQG